MVFNTGTTNMGTWTCWGETYLHDSGNTGVGLPYTTTGSDYVIVDWRRITSGTYNSNGDAPTVAFGWSWGVNSSWGGYEFPAGTVSFTGDAIEKISYTNYISHWSWGYKNQEGNNSDKRAFLLGETTWSQQYNSTYTMNSSRGVTVPNGFTLRSSFSTSNISGTWTTYGMGTNVTQINGSMWYEYDYDPIDYTITYTMNGGTNNSANPSSYNVLYGVTFNNPTRTGYTFSKWTINDSTVTGINPGANATFSSVDDLRTKCSARTTGNKTVVANWTANTYTVTYNGNGYTGGSTSNTSHTYGVAKALATNGFTRTGYTFKQWNTKSDGTGTAYTSGQSVSNLTSTNGGTVTLYAIWTVNKYQIDVNGLLDGTNSGSISGYGTFDITIGGTKVGENVNDYCTTHNYGSSYSISDVKAVTGKTYNGVSSGSLTGTVGTSGVSVRLKFTTNTYTIAYNANGGSGAPSGQTKTYGTSLTLSTTVPTYVGYTFLGWSTSSTATSATYAAGATLSSDLTTTNGATVTLYAVWKATAPYNLGISFISATDTSITIKCSCESRVDGLTWTAYYTGGGQLKYSTSSTTSGSLRECSLMLAERNYVLEDRNYNIYFTVTNSTGTTTSNTVTYSTTLGALTASQILTTDVTPFTIKVSMNEGTTTHPTKDKYWLYSCDGGVTWRQKMGNLFNIQKWIDHVPTVYADDTCSVDTNGVTITAVNSADAYTHTMHWTTSGNIVSARDIARVGIYGTPCVGGLTYALAYTPSNSTSKTQAYIHFYDEDFCVIDYPGLNSATSTSRRVFTTTAPSNARWMSVRFDNDTQNSTVTFKDIYLGLDTIGTYVPYEEDSGSYEFTGLEEETTYVIQGMLSVMNDGVTSYPKAITHPAITITTPADQARIQVKTEEVWQKGKTYFKKDGEWVKAKKIYIKKDGVWVLGSNNGS